MLLSQLRMYSGLMVLRPGVFVMMSFVVGAILLSANSAEAATLALSPSTGSATVGSIFSVNVLLNTEGAPIDGVDIRHLTYNPLLLEVVDEELGVAGVQIIAGSLMGATPANIVDTVNGLMAFSQVPVGGVTFSNTSAQTLASVRFRVLGAGTTTVAFAFTPGNTADTNVASAGADILTAVTNGSFSLTANQSPVTILSDSFETGLFWTQAGDVAWYTGTPKNGTHAVRLRTTGSIERALPLTGYQDITVSFAMGANSLDNNNENLQALYFDGLSWRVLTQINNNSAQENNSLNSYSFVLPANVNNLATFAVRFKLNGSASNDSGFVDDVVVRGVPFVQGSVPLTSGIATGDRVFVTANLNVRSNPSLVAAKVATQPIGAVGSIASGPVVVDGHTWWQVDYDPAADGVGDGWSIEPYLAKLYPVLPEVGINESDGSGDQGIFDKLFAEIMYLQAQVSSVVSQLASLAIGGQ